tara:strand:+ start:482 stop:745 length:264 start_codon:yes stop_codon:yes gene_type:complete
MMSKSKKSKNPKTNQEKDKKNGLCNYFNFEKIRFFFYEKFDFRKSFFLDNVIITQSNCRKNNKPIQRKFFPHPHKFDFRIKSNPSHR